MAKIVTEHIHLAYELGKKVFSKQWSLKLAVDHLTELGMNENSAEMYVTFYLCLRRDTLATREISLEALNYFLSMILQEETAEHFALAMTSFKNHIDWYEQKFNKPVVGKSNIYRRFEAYLPQSAVLYFDEQEFLASPTPADSETNYLEGARKTVTVNAYERNPKARQACLAHYGYACQICGFDFERVYGDIGKQFIHVHHKQDLAVIGETYQVHPTEDLIPVCPNCHAMLHQQTPAYSVAQVQALLQASKSLLKV